MRVTMTAAVCCPAVACRRTKYDGDLRFKRSWVHNHLFIPRALRQRATKNIDMAV
jgi:hypothetical protein